MNDSKTLVKLDKFLCTLFKVSKYSYDLFKHVNEYLQMSDCENRAVAESGDYLYSANEIEAMRRDQDLGIHLFCQSKYHLF